MKWTETDRCFLQGPDRSARQVVTAVTVEAERIEILRSQPHAKQFISTVLAACCDSLRGVDVVPAEPDATRIA